MKSMQERLREHIEFHEVIDSHKSEAAFLREVLEFVKDIEGELNRLEVKEFCCVCNEEQLGEVKG